MKKLLTLAAFGAVFSATACAAPITPFGFYVGYFRGNSFSDRLSNSVHLSGFELGVQQSLVSLPLLGAVDIGASVCFGGSLKDSGSVNGNLYRIYAQYKSPSGVGPIYAVGGFGYYLARGSSFNNQSGFGTEIGIGYPLKLGGGIPGLPGAAIEARYRLGQRAATKGWAIGVTVQF